MGLQKTLICLTLSILSGCVSTGASMPSEEILDCPVNEYVVCRGGTVSRIGNPNRRDPRFCSCQPKEHIE